MKIGSGAPADSAAIQRQTRKLRDKSRELREKRENGVEDMKLLENYAPGSQERRDVGSMLMSRLELVNFEAQEVGGEKAELARMRTGAAKRGGPEGTAAKGGESEETGEKKTMEENGVHANQGRGGVEYTVTTVEVDPEGPPGQIVDKRA